MSDKRQLDQKLVRLFIEAPSAENYEELKKNYILYYTSLQNTDAPYPEITNYVLSNKMNINIDSIIEIYTNDETFATLNGLGWQDFLKSFEKHYKLAEIQKKHIENMFSEMKKDVKEAEDKVNEIKDIKSTIYTEFIAILGIFSALLFGMFVGFDTFKELIAGITSNVKISRVVILGSLMLLGLNFLVFLLFEGIGKLSNREIKSCCSKTDCNCSIVKKHPMFMLSNAVLLGILLLASVVMIINSEGMIYSTNYKWFFVIIIVLLIIELGIDIYYFLKEK